MAGIVIIGAGQGGLQLAASLRQDGCKGAITLIGDEPHLPYQRPPLSKAYMADGNPDGLVLKPGSFFERMDIDLKRATRALRIDRAGQRVDLSDGSALPYDHLVLATGTRNARPPIPGADAPGVMGLRTLDDAETLRQALAGARRAVIIGGGFIGLEFAAMARKAGVAVSVIEAAPRLMARAVSAPMAMAFHAMHTGMGTDLRLNALAAAVLTGTGGHAEGVRLTDGSELTGDLILMATGVRPNIELAAEAGLAVGDGVLVNGQLVTSDPMISALGDVCAFPHEGARVRLESVQAAVDHARHLSKRLAQGHQDDYAAVPWFWSDQGGWKLQIAGLSAGADEVVALPADNGPPRVLHFRDDRLAAVETVNNPGAHMAARALIGAPKALISDCGFDLRAALKERKTQAAAAQ